MKRNANNRPKLAINRQTLADLSLEQVAGGAKGVTTIDTKADCSIGTCLKIRTQCH